MTHKCMGQHNLLPLSSEIDGQHPPSNMSSTDKYFHATFDNTPQLSGTIPLAASHCKDYNYRDNAQEVFLQLIDCRLVKLRILTDLPYTIMVSGHCQMLANKQGSIEDASGNQNQFCSQHTHIYVLPTFMSSNSPRNFSNNLTQSFHIIIAACIAF